MARSVWALGEEELVEHIFASYGTLSEALDFLYDGITLASRFHQGASHDMGIWTVRRKVIHE
jgi:hypothetical protein